MRGVLDTAGETVAIDCDDRRLWPLIAEAAGGCLTQDAVETATVELVIENDRRPFTIRNATVLTRGAVRNEHAVVFDDACASGFSLRLEPRDDHLRVFARYRPDPKVRLASMALRARFRLIARAVLLQYPVLWWAGVRGRPPLHVSAVTSDVGTAVLAGPGGVGKSTLLQREISRGAAATCDNLAVSDGVDVFGMAEPIRVESGTGRRVTHGRRESPWPQTRVTSLRAERVVVVSLDDVPVPSCTPVHPEVAVRSLIAGTYMAGELRRYWAFAATLALGTGRGPVQPQIEQLATRMCTSLPCHLLTLSRRAVTGLSDVFAQAPEGLLQ